MCNMAGFGWKTSWVMWRLMLLLIQVDVINLNVIAVASVTVNHDGRGGTALVPLSGIRGSQKKPVSLLLGLMLILPLYLVLPVSWMGLGCRFKGVELLVLILLPGLTVLASCASLLLFLGPYIGLLVLLTWAILGSLVWSFLSFLRNGLDTDCSVKR